MLNPFPENFLFGVGSSDHQCEAYDPAFEDIRDVWDRLHGNYSRRRATDFWVRFPEDIRHAASLGCKLFRFSVSWARVEPSPGEFSAEALAHYREVVDEIVHNDMEPLVTLHHFTWPVHIQERGGMLAKEFPERFRLYAQKTAETLGAKVAYWITFNEPTILAYGYLKPWWERNYFFPPGLPGGTSGFEQITAVATLMRNLFLAHTEARAAIRELNPAAKVGSNPSLLGLPTWLQKLIDRNATRLSRVEDLERVASQLTKRPFLAAGKVDLVVATLTATKSREEKIHLSEAYFVSVASLLLSCGSKIRNAGNLAQERVAVLKSTTTQEKFSSLLPFSIPEVFGKRRDALAALDAGVVCAFLSDHAILSGIVSESSGKYRLINLESDGQEYVAGMAKGHPLFTETVDRAIRDFKKSGAWAKSVEQHLPDAAKTMLPQDRQRYTLALGEDGRTGGGPLPPAPQGTLLRHIQDRGYLKAGVNRDVPGFGFSKRENGQIYGLEIDLAHEIARVIFGDRNKVRFYPVKTSQRIKWVCPVLRFVDPIFKFLTVFRSLLSTNWWHLGMAGKLPEFLCPRECVGKEDFVGLDYYWGLSVLQPWKIFGFIQSMSKGRFDLAPVWPRGLRARLKHYSRLLPGKELIVVENGCVDQAGGIDRGTYLRKHIREVQKAYHDGVPVSKYVAWSITTNVEWGNAPAPCCDFGLFRIALETDPYLKRQETSSAAEYREIIRLRTAELRPLAVRSSTE